MVLVIASAKVTLLCKTRAPIEAVTVNRGDIVRPWSDITAPVVNAVF